MVFGGTLRKFRSSSGMSQKEVSEKLGIDRSTYSCYETGKLKPDFEIIVKLSHIFDIDLRDFADEFQYEGKVMLKSNDPNYKLSTDDDFSSLSYDEKFLITYLRSLEDVDHEQFVTELKKRYLKRLLGENNK